MGAVRGRPETAAPPPAAGPPVAGPPHGTERRPGRWVPRRTRDALARLLAWLPQGGLLPEDRWRRRHRGLLRLLWAHAVGVFFLALAVNPSPAHAIGEATVLAVPATLAGLERIGRRTRSALVAIGLVFASAVLVHLSGGVIEAHFHFFVVVALLSLYQDWVPFGLACGFVFAHHGIMGTLDPSAVYNHPSAVAHPWLWAGIHGAALSASAGASLIAWRVNEDQALHDSETGLANRRLLADRAGFLLRRREAGVVALVYVDLDDFKLVNDRLGHSAGDRMLAEVARRLLVCVRSGDTVARIGGDEFAVLLDGLAHPDEALEVARRIQEALSRTYDLGTRSLAGAASIGLATTTGEAAPSLDALLRNADLAMYAAKAAGRGALRVFERPMYEALVEQSLLEQQVQLAFARGEFVLHYQPVVDLRSGAMTGVEALVRWNHPERGLLAPGAFLPAIQNSGQMPRLTRWVLAEGCAWARDRRLAHPDEPPLVLGVNVTPADLLEPGLLDAVRQVLDGAGLDGRSLCVEVTENAVLDDMEASRPVLAALRELGVSVAVDDFGTGYSSLSHLRQLPLDTVKIDRSFVQGLCISAGDSAVVTALVDLAHTLGFSVVAEGVQTPDQIGALRALGCEHAQGFLLAQPVPAADLPTQAEIRERWAARGGPAAAEGAPDRPPALPRPAPPR